MTDEIRFYHLTTTGTDRALPVLLQRTLERNWRAVILTDSQERVHHLNQHLWTFDQGSFLPHGSKEEGDAENQPIWLTDTEENPNRSQVLFLLDNMTCQNLDSFDLICLIFDGNNEESLNHARALWKQWKSAAPCPLSYWQQTPEGSWQQKVSTKAQTGIEE